MKRRLLFLFFVLNIAQSAYSQNSSKPYKHVWLATALNILPGAGHLYLGEYATASGLFTSFGVTSGVSAYWQLNSKKIDENTIQVPFEPKYFLLSSIYSSNIWSYGIYAAYRDARLNNNNKGYAFDMPTDDMGDLISAPFSWKVISKPEVWGGVLAGLAAGIGVSYLAKKVMGAAQVNYLSLSNSSNTTSLDSVLARQDLIYHTAFVVPIGIGEEAISRGFFYPVFAELFNNEWGGVISSSLLFGLMHGVNAIGVNKDKQLGVWAVQVPWTATLGVYLGWLTKKNKSLRESVAVHFWYDLVIFSLQAIQYSMTPADNNNEAGQGQVIMLPINLSF